MVMLTDLADACRKSGLRVIEQPGWQTRGHGPMTTVETIVCHHTATAATAKGDYPSLGIVRDGRPGLSGPLAQLGLGRDGTVYVIAAGVAYHAGEVFERRQDNWHAIGIEAEHPGTAPVWPTVQYAAYVRLVAALTLHYGVPIANVQGHKEVAKPLGRKVDPTFGMAAFRAAVLTAQTAAAKAEAPDVRDNLTAAAKSTKAALAQAKGRPRLSYQLDRARKAISKARRINRGKS